MTEAVQAAMKPKEKRTEKERLLVQLGNLQKRLDGLEASIGRMEDKLGLPRSRFDEPRDDRFRRIHNRQTDTVQ